MKYFGGIPIDNLTMETAEVILQPIPYDGTSTWGKGADKWFLAFMEAADNMELYDIETKSEVYKTGIYVNEVWNDFSSPEDMFSAVYERTKDLINSHKFLTFFGGEHSVSIGIIKALREKHKGLNVLHLDAHADLRSSYLGSNYNHACALHDASRHCNLVQVGIRSMDSSELDYINDDQVFYAKDIIEDNEWMDASIALLEDPVFITLDLDVLDPSIMPSTGTPEPGGLEWYQLLRYLRKVFNSKQVIGFDIVELAPIEGLRAPNFLAAKLYYKMLSYKFFPDE